MNKIISWLTNPPTDAPKSTLLLRLMAGGVFFWEGLMKFIYVNQGVGRFTKLGIPFPHYTATFIGGLGIVGGLLLLAGLTTEADCDSVRSRNDCGDSFDEDLLVSGNVALAAASSAATGGFLGCVARNTIRLCPDTDSHFSPRERTWRMVPGCGAGGIFSGVWPSLQSGESQVRGKRRCNPKPALDSRTLPPIPRPNCYNQAITLVTVWLRVKWGCFNSYETRLVAM